MRERVLVALIGALPGLLIAYWQHQEKMVELGHRLQIESDASFTQRTWVDYAKENCDVR